MTIEGPSGISFMQSDAKDKPQRTKYD